MNTDFILLPTPRQLHLTGESFDLSTQGLIALDGPGSQALLPIAQRVQSACRAPWEIVAGKAGPGEQIRLALNIVPGSTGHPQGYTLTITPQRIDIVAEQPVGIFYASQTLRQLIEQSPDALPTLHCADRPDFPNRGIMLDISRDRVPNMGTLYTLVDMFASWKINQLQLYTEHTFAYRNHPEVWAQASPMTGEQVLDLDAYCRERFIELIPNQNTFGHMRPWLMLERYRPLAEAPDGCDTRWGHFDDPFSLNPSDPRSLELVHSLLDELLPHFTSQQVNVGCDETVDLGQGGSKERVEKLGIGRVYLDFVLQIYRTVKARGRTMQFWGDIIMEHPELTPELPRDAIALEWGYEANHPFDEHGARFAASGIPFYTCPGTSSWNTIAGRTDNALENLRNAAENGLKHGAVGYLITDWGDNGHWQPLPVSYLGYAYGAAISWAYQANHKLNIARVLDQHAFQDASGVMGQLAYDLGNIYQAPGALQHNSSILFTFLQSDLPRMKQRIQAIPDLHALQVTLARIDEIMAALPGANMHCSDANLVQSEFAWAADLLRHACQRALWAADQSALPPDQLCQQAEGLIGEYRRLWHARSRPGGFRESLARLEKMRDSYR